VSRSRENLDRLAAAMCELNARLRVAGMTDEEALRLPVQLEADMLVSAEISTWMTNAGGFDVLPGLVGGDRRVVPYEELVRRENLIEGEGFSIPADLEDVITAKEHADRSKDREALPELHAIRDARAASSGGTSSSTGSPRDYRPLRRWSAGVALHRCRTFGEGTSNAGTSASLPATPSSNRRMAGKACRPIPCAIVREAPVNKGLQPLRTDVLESSSDPIFAPNTR
jgi:hypothetical protein